MIYDFQTSFYTLHSFTFDSQRPLTLSLLHECSLTYLVLVILYLIQLCELVFLSFTFIYARRYVHLIVDCIRSQLAVRLPSAVLFSGLGTSYGENLTIKYSQIDLTLLTLNWIDSKKLTTTKIHDIWSLNHSAGYMILLTSFICVEALEGNITFSELLYWTLGFLCSCKS